MKQDEQLNVHNCKECTPCVCIHTCDCTYPYENCTHPIKLEFNQSNVHNNCEECTDTCETDTSKECTHCD